MRSCVGWTLLDAAHAQRIVFATQSSQMYRWLSYGNDPHSTSVLTDKTYFVRREMSFTIANDIYIRYQCFKDKEDMIAQIQKMKVSARRLVAAITVFFA